MAFSLAPHAAAQLLDAEERPTRKELKQSVSKMTYESGDRRILKLDGMLEALSPGASRKAKSKQQKIRPFSDVAVQCNPLGEAVSIGVLPKKRKAFKPEDFGKEIEIDAPSSIDIPDKDWRRIAELACLEDEI